MHLQQTKADSRDSGGSQYYFHGLTGPVKEYLRKRGVCPVVLRTPYGIAASSFQAVGWKHKVSADGQAVPGKVGHDRIQGDQSIGEAIRYWYGLGPGRDFERVEVEAEIHRDGHFILVPLSAKMRGSSRAIVLEQIDRPLSFHRDHQSKL